MTGDCETRRPPNPSDKTVQRWLLGCSCSICRGDYAPDYAVGIGDPPYRFSRGGQCPPGVARLDLNHRCCVRGPRVGPWVCEAGRSL